jgi:hypothetical protein
VEVRKKTWQERLFSLIELGDAFVACKGGTGTLVELAVVWEMLSKSVMEPKPFIVLGDFWRPILLRVKEVEQGKGASTGVRDSGAAGGNLVHSADGVIATVKLLTEQLGAAREKRQVENRG